MKIDKSCNIIFDEIKQTPGASVDILHGKKHQKLKITYMGRSLLVVVPSTASDHRTALNCRSLVRRFFKETAVV